MTDPTYADTIDHLTVTITNKISSNIPVDIVMRC